MTLNGIVSELAAESWSAACADDNSYENAWQALRDYQTAMFRNVLNILASDSKIDTAAYLRLYDIVAQTCGFAATEILTEIVEFYTSGDASHNEIEALCDEYRAANSSDSQVAQTGVEYEFIEINCVICGKECSGTFHNDNDETVCFDCFA